MRLSIKLFETRYVLKIFLQDGRKIKWLPTIMWGKVSRAPMEKNT